MNYDKLSRSLRYYYEKGIMQKASDPAVMGEWVKSVAVSHCHPSILGHSRKGAMSSVSPARLVIPQGAQCRALLTPSSSLQVAGERYVYKFVCDPDALFSMAYPDNQRPFLKTEPDCPVPEEETVPLTHFEDSPAYLLEMDPCGSLPYAEGFAY